MRRVKKPRRPQPSPHLAGLRAYTVPRAPAPTDLKLDSNEGVSPPPSALRVLRASHPNLLRRYLKPRALEERMAAAYGLRPQQVLALAGADEAIDRACRVYVAPDREVVVPVPTFEMCITFARLAGGRIKPVSWPQGRFPTQAIIDAVTPRTGMIILISPNNPTGACIPAAALRRIAAAAPHAVVLMDLAYAQFADLDLTPAALRLPNTIAVHTLSKAWGLAGLRVGFAMGAEEIIAPLRISGAPYSLSNLSHTVAESWLRNGRRRVEATVARIRRERGRLTGLLAELGARPLPSQANFVFARFSDALWVRDALAGLGIAVRLIPAVKNFPEGLRITCPGNATDFQRLEKALRTVLAPKHLFLAIHNREIRQSDYLRFRRAVARRKLASVTGLVHRQAKLINPWPAGSWLITNRVELVAQARKYGALPIGFLSPQAVTEKAMQGLYAAGAARVLTDLKQLEGLP